MFQSKLLTVKGLDHDSRGPKFIRAYKNLDDTMNYKEFEAWFLAQDFKQLGHLKHFDNRALLFRLLQPVSFHYYVIKKPFWKRFTSVLGFTEGKVISTYSDAYDRMSDAELMGHIGHELTHILGFSHAVKWSEERDQSLPYLVGDYLEKSFK